MKTLQHGLGSVVINSSNLELMLSILVVRLISDDSIVGAIITSEMSFQNKLAALDALTKYRITDPERIKRLAMGDLLKRLDAAEQKRNQIMHSAYMLKEDQSTMDRVKVTAKRKNGLRFVTETIDEDSLKQIITEQVDLTRQLQALYTKLYPGEPIRYG